MEKRDFLKTTLFAAGALLIPRKSLALAYYPTGKNAEWAILYGTWCGSSRDASVWLSEGMEEYDNLKRDECMAFGREILRINE